MLARYRGQAAAMRQQQRLELRAGSTPAAAQMLVGSLKQQYSELCVALAVLVGTTAGMKLHLNESNTLHNRPPHSGPIL